MTHKLKSHSILAWITVFLVAVFMAQSLVVARSSDVPTAILMDGDFEIQLTEQRILLEQDGLGLKPINYIEYSNANEVLTFYETGDNTGEPVAVYEYDPSEGVYQVQFETINGSALIQSPCETPARLSPVFPTSVDTSGGQYYIEDYVLDKGAPYLVELSTNSGCGSDATSSPHTVVFLADNPTTDDTSPTSPTSPTTNDYGQTWYDYDGTDYIGFPSAGRYLFISPFEIIDTEETYPGTDRNVIYGITEKSNFSSQGSQRLMEDGLSVYWPISATAATTEKRSYSISDYAIKSEDETFCRGGIAVRTESGTSYGRISRVPATLIANSCQVIKGDPAATDSARIEIAVSQLLNFIDDDNFPQNIDVSWRPHCTNSDGDICTPIDIGNRFYGSLRNAAAFYAQFEWINPDSIRVYHRTADIRLEPIQGEMVERIRNAIPDSMSYGNGTTKDDLEFWTRNECRDGDTIPWAILAINHNRTVDGIRDIDVTHQNMAGYLFIRDGTTAYRSGWNDSNNGTRCITQEAIEDNAVDYLHYRVGIRDNISGEGGSAYIALVANSSTGGVSDSPRDATIVTIDQGDEVEETCETRFNNPLTWLACPLINLADEFIITIDKQLDGLLQIDSDDYNPRDGGELKQSWSIIKNIATVAIVFTAIFMVISTALDFGFFSNYTVKKYMPRLVIAVVALQLSWVLATFFIDIVNEIGSGLEAILYYPFPEARDMSLASIFAQGQSGTETTQNTALFASVVAGGAGIVFLTGLGLFGVLALAYTVATALLGAFIALIFRKIAVLVLLILTPLAIAAWVLPGDDGLWKKWRSTFTALLFMYPAIILIIAFGKIFAYISLDAGSAGSNDLIVLLIALIAYIGGYFAIPVIMKSFTGAFSNLTGMVNDRSKGFIDKGRNSLTQKRDQQKQWAKDRKLSEARMKEARGETSIANRFRTGTLGAGRGKREAARRQMAADRLQGVDEMIKENEYAAQKTYVDSQGRRHTLSAAEAKARTKLDAARIGLDQYNPISDRQKLEEAEFKNAVDSAGAELDQMAKVDPANHRAYLRSQAAAAQASGDDARFEAVMERMIRTRDAKGVRAIQQNAVNSGDQQMISQLSQAIDKNFSDLNSIDPSLTIKTVPTGSTLDTEMLKKYQGTSPEKLASMDHSAWIEYSRVDRAGALDAINTVLSDPKLRNNMNRQSATVLEDFATDPTNPPQVPDL